MSDGCGDLPLADGQTVVFTGDSITDCGRRAANAPLGDGYVSMVVALATAANPDRRITFINTGIGGDVSTGLRDRWTDDVLVHRPDWVSVLIGINDLHRTLRGSPEAVAPEAYRAACENCLRRTAENTSAKIVLMEPFYMSRETTPDSWRGRVLAALEAYRAAIADLAEQFGAIHVRLHEMFQEVLRHRPADVVCPEPVHPNHTGHLMIARAWLKAVCG